ncbi:MAG: RDD family protein [Chloroflexota bacterium]|nr:MAG: RDD family protein [Chloroflexota bacterium]
MKREIEGLYAGAATRGIAWVIDQVLIVVTLGVVAWFVTTTYGLFNIDLQNCEASSGSIWYYACVGARFGLGIFAVAFSPIYFIFFWTLSGQTIGDAILGIRVVRLDGKPMTIPRSIRRFIGYLVCFITLGIGFLLMLIDDQRQGLHDMLAGTCVIYAWRGEQDTQTVARLQNWMTERRRPAGQEPTANSKA